MKPILVITNLPDKKTALKLAKKLINKKLAACVNIHAPCTSFYRWKNKIETANEQQIFIKTLAPHYIEIENTIKKIHPYELPEIITVPIDGGLPAYLQWISDETTTSNKN
ncbi:MAG: divalent-cation tolerance protein CutA [Nitrosomonadaceae bacterium]|nr:divalent-cation tolerance protein CutA [Nitrosomonadaceae bacterium]|tara:strand:- start:1033 stop:1362 length:330 start_codon:yes stop_codon:yes gene_type:complete